MGESERCCYLNTLESDEVANFLPSESSPSRPMIPSPHHIAWFFFRPDIWDEIVIKGEYNAKLHLFSISHWPGTRSLSGQIKFGTMNHEWSQFLGFPNFEQVQMTALPRYSVALKPLFDECRHMLCTLALQGKDRLDREQGKLASKKNETWSDSRGNGDTEKSDG